MRLLWRIALALLAAGVVVFVAKEIGYGKGYKYNPNYNWVQ